MKNLFTDVSPPPTKARSKSTKTPVSILKSKKHFKRNSLTPPMLKKDKRIDGKCNGKILKGPAEPRRVPEFVGFDEDYSNASIDLPP